MTRRSVPGVGDQAHALELALDVLETGVYRSLSGIVEACDDIAARAQQLGLVLHGVRARLLASDVRSRLGSAAQARAEQLDLYAAAQAWPALARHAATYLVSSCDRLGDRVQAMQWARLSVSAEDGRDAPAWHAEALMVAALFSMTRPGADYTLVDQALAAVRACTGPVMISVTAANFAEAASECGELGFASHFADEAEATMRRHPEAAAALTWESVARARLALSELPAAEHAMKESLRVEERLGCCDVNGDPWLTYAEILLERDEPEGALSMLEHPRRGQREAGSSWTNLRALHVRSRVMAALMRWEEAYRAMTQYAAAYERVRSIEGDRAVAESSAAVAVDEERRRSQHFERLALTDTLTGLPNRRHAERWLVDHAQACAGVDGSASDELCVAIADIDHFKRVNDDHSHDTGDLVLKRFSALLTEWFTPLGTGGENAMLAARLGGEEFLLAWSGIPIDVALRQSKAFCERLRATSFADLVGATPITASLGLACGPRPVDPGTLLRAADRCLYAAKQAGRDRVIAVRVD